jgi:hypothetical protein
LWKWKNNTLELKGIDADAFEVVRQYMYGTYKFSFYEGSMDFKLPEAPEISSVTRFFRVMELANDLKLNYLIGALCEFLVNELMESLSRFAGRRKYILDLGNFDDGRQMDNADKKKRVQALAQFQEDLSGPPPDNADHHQRLLDEHFEQISRLPGQLRQVCQDAVLGGIVRTVDDAVSGRIFLLTPVTRLMHEDAEFASKLCLKLGSHVKEVQPLVDCLDEIARSDGS